MAAGAAAAGLPLVLVHGGGHGAWCWNPTIAHLRSPAVAVDLPPVSIRGGPGRLEMPPGIETLSLADWANAVVAAADRAGYDRFVLVGHSLAGLTICETARLGPDRVARLVFVSALVPPDGSNGLDAMPADMMERFANGLTEDAVRSMFCSDLDEEQAQFVLDNVGTDAPQVMLEPVSRSGIPAALPKTFVRLLRDCALAPAAQDASIAALRAVPGGEVDVVELDTGHDVMVGHPAELAALLDDLAFTSV